MRHRKGFNHLGRTSAHRKAMLANMASSLILHKKINTTVAKAKALRIYVEPLITKSKNDTTHSRRVVFSYLKNKYAVAELFREISPKVADRPGGYTRILKTGSRLGDNADMCIIELVDYNENMLSDTGKKAKSTRRRRGGGGSRKAEGAAAETVEASTKETQELNTSETVDETMVTTTEEVAEDTDARAEEEKAEEIAEEAKTEKEKSQKASEEVIKETKAEEKAEEPVEQKIKAEKEAKTEDSTDEEIAEEEEKKDE